MHFDKWGKKLEAAIRWQLREVGHLLHQDGPIFEDDFVDNKIFRGEIWQSRAVLAETIEADGSSAVIDQLSKKFSKN